MLTEDERELSRRGEKHCKVPISSGSDVDTLDGNALIFEQNSMLLLGYVGTSHFFLAPSGNWGKTLKEGDTGPDQETWKSYQRKNPLRYRAIFGFYPTFLPFSFDHYLGSPGLQHCCVLSFFLLLLQNPRIWDSIIHREWSLNKILLWNMCLSTWYSVRMLQTTRATHG